MSGHKFIANEEQVKALHRDWGLVQMDPDYVVVVNFHVAVTPLPV